MAQETLTELGDGETRTYARAHELLAECRGDLRRSRGPPERGRELPGGRRGVGVVRRVRQGPRLPPRPGARRPGPARAVRRGPRPGQPAAEHPGPVRRRALVDGARRGVRALQRQPPRQRRVTVRPGHRPRLRPRQPPPDRGCGVGTGAGRVPQGRPVGHAAVDRDRREHRPRGDRRRARRPVPVRRRDDARRARRARPGHDLPRSCHRPEPRVPRPGPVDRLRAQRPQGGPRRRRRVPGPDHAPRLVAGQARGRPGRGPQR